MPSNTHDFNNLKMLKLAIEDTVIYQKSPPILSKYSLTWEGSIDFTKMDNQIPGLTQGHLFSL